ncbi:MAG: hypothetical protein GY849_02410 [Deltaproteobacteria bacterium]|nr:hypothetical protein [Deltaproteobacteria bacterium]
MANPILSYIRIDAKFWKAKFKYLDYTERKYINNERVYKTHSDPERILTNDKLKLIHDNKRDLNRLVQTIWYERVYIEVFFEENFDYAFLQACNEITLFDENQLTYECEFVEANEENIGGTISKVILSFRVLKDNEDAISNYLTSDIINEKSLAYNKIVFSNYRNIDSLIDFSVGETLEFKTYFEPIIERSNIELIKDYHKLGIETIDNSMDFEIVKLRFILTDNELMQLEKYGKRCFYYDNSENAKGTNITTQVSPYIAEKNIEYEIISNEMLIDCNIVDITLFHDFVDYSNYYLTTDEITSLSLNSNSFIYENYQTIDDRTNRTQTTLKSVFDYKKERLIIKDEQIEVRNSINATTNIVDCLVYSLKFVLTENEYLDFQKYAKRCFDYNNAGQRGNKFVINGVTIVAKEQIDFEISQEKDYIDNKIVTIKLKTDFLNFRQL